MDHWHVAAAGLSDDFTSISPAKFYEKETFQLELRTGDDRAVRISGHRDLLKHARQRMATDGDIRLLGTQICRTMSDVTGADLSVHALASGSERISDTKAAEEAGTFWLELKTHGDQSIRIEGERTLFQNTKPPLVTGREVSQLGEQVINAINTVTGEIELGGTAEV